MSDHAGTGEIWPAFTDVMSTMAIILFVLVLLAYVRNVIASKRLEAFQRQIDASQQQLRALGSEIQASRAALVASQARLRDQQAIITDSNLQLDALRGQLQSIAVLRVSVLGKLKQAIEVELGPKNARGTDLVTIGDNGNIVINESVVFDFGSYAVKKEAKPLLDTLARALGNVLADPNVAANIDTILIQNAARRNSTGICRRSGQRQSSRNCSKRTRRSPIRTATTFRPAPTRSSAPSTAPRPKTHTSRIVGSRSRSSRRMTTSARSSTITCKASVRRRRRLQVREAGARVSETENSERLKYEGMWQRLYSIPPRTDNAEAPSIRGSCVNRRLRRSP
jgi:chemotaxis protein MotB